MNLHRLTTALAMFACLGAAASARAAIDTPLCQKEIAAATSKLNDVPYGIRTRMERAVGKASALVRFHRIDEGLAKLDAIVTLLDGPRGERLPDSTRTELTTSIHALRRCLASAGPPPLATITIQVFEEDGSPEGNPGRRAEAGVYVDVEGIRIGRTGADGTVQASVPSGTIRITAIEYPSSIGGDVVELSPGESATSSVVLADSKEPGEDSDLLLEEAPDDILSADATSLTLSFVQDDAPVAIDRIEGIELSETHGNTFEDLQEFFRVARGAIHSTNAAALYSRILKHSRIGRPLSLAVSAIDTEGRFHHGHVSFYLGRFRLAVTLSAPPSNPGLPVANIPVRVSVMGSDVAVRRTSDAGGRFEIDVLPDATVAFDAETVASGVHYYGDATLTMCADRAVTVVMMNVKDRVAGTRPLTIDAGPTACPPVPRQ
jgi:hypothetical protein